MPICLRNINPLLALYCHPNDPVAGTVLLPNQTTTVLRLQSYQLNDRAYTPAIYRPNDHTCMPTINRPTDRQALYLTTIITVASTVLPPGQTAAMLVANSDLTVAALPAVYQYFAAPACS